MISIHRLMRPHSALALAALLTLAACSPSDPGGHTPSASAVAAAKVPQPGAGEYVIRGDAGDLKEGDEVKLITSSFDNGRFGQVQLASGKVKDGKFELRGTVERAGQAGLVADAKRYGQMVVERGEFSAKVVPGTVVIHGGDIHDKVFGHRATPEYQAAARAYAEAMNKVFEGVDMGNEKAMIQARGKAQKLEDKASPIENARLSVLIDDPATPPMTRLMALLTSNDFTRYDLEKRKAMMNKIEEEIGPQPGVAMMLAAFKMSQEHSAAAKRFGVGAKYEDISAKDAQGKVIKLSEVVARNKLTLLDFWASWCGPCRAEFPHLRKVYEAHRAQGFEIYALSVDEDADAWANALSEEKAPWINTVEPDGITGKAPATYGVLGLPSNYLIRKDGTIVGVNMREWDVERAVAAELAGGPAGASSDAKQ